MAAGGADLPQLIVEAVREKARTVRALRTKWALLARDLLALATGMRTAAMLDYVALQPEALLDLVGTVAGICHEAGPLPKLRVDRAFSACASHWHPLHARPSLHSMLRHTLSQRLH